jgi:UDP-glucose 4-epimerase
MTKTIVTGGAGFIGSHLVDCLAADSDWGNILVIDNFHRGRRDNLSQHLDNPRVSITEIDIRHYAALEKALQGADYIFHLAAQSNVMGAIENLDYSFETNVVGTYNVLKAARAGGNPRVLFSSSREVYGEAQYVPVDEGHPIGGKNSYGASKVAGEVYCQVFAANFGLETVIVRLANVYGSRDFGRVIPLWLDRAKTNRDLTVYGGEQVIDFVSVQRVIEAMQVAIKADVVGTPINVGSGQGTPILTLAERILSIARTDSQLDHQPARDVEVKQFVAQVDRMRQLLALEPPVDPLDQLEALYASW